MITKVLYGMPDGFPSRTILPTDPPQKYYHAPRFIPAHIETLHRFGETRQRKQKVPDCARFNGAYSLSLPVKEGLVLDKPFAIARIIRDEDAVLIDNLDKEIEALVKQRADTLKTVFRRGRQLRRTDLL